MNTKRTLFLKCLLTGLIYAVITCIVQVPIASAVSSLLNIPPDTSIPSDVVPMLLLSLFVVGVAIAFFYYRYGYLFASASKWKQALKFSLFICFSNYIPQVSMMDAANGFHAMITGGFPVIQVELYDCIILVATALCMVRYMPCRNQEKKANSRINWCRCIVCGGVFAACLSLLMEVILPLLGFGGGMAAGFGVAKEHLLFFYAVLLTGFVMTGFLVSYYADKTTDAHKAKWYFIEYGVFIWGFFCLTMIPLGFGVSATVIFAIASLFAFDVTRNVHKLLK